MLSNDTINAQRHGIYDALRIVENTPILSDESMNNLLQILYDDLRNANNIVFTQRAKKTHFNAPASATRNIATAFIEYVGTRDQNGVLDPLHYRYISSGRLYPEEICKHSGFGICHFLIGKMLTKHLFLYQLNQAKMLLRASPFLMTDPGRTELLRFLLKIETKAMQQKERAINAVMLKMHSMAFFHRVSKDNFRRVVDNFITAEQRNNKTLLNVVIPSLTVKRWAKPFNRLESFELKNKIQELLSENSTLYQFYKESALLEKLVELNHSDEVKYKHGTEVTLYYTGSDVELDWYTQEECNANKFPLNNQTIRRIPTEFQYNEEMKQIAAKYEKI